MNDVDPQAYLRDVLAKIVARHPMERIDELLPFAYLPSFTPKKTPRLPFEHVPVILATPVHPQWRKPDRHLLY
jgi:hypothetical protein